MAFAFNFKVQCEPPICNDLTACQTSHEAEPPSVIGVDKLPEEAKEIFIQPQLEFAEHEYESLEVNDGSVNVLIKHVTGHQVEAQLHQSVLPSGERPDIIGALEHNIDVLPNVYEGGLKIWDCSIDLTRYVYSLTNSSMSGNKVLELGCGAGLPGIAAYLRGADQVHFQDYNEEVLKLVTRQNVLLNSPRSPDTTHKCRFFSGDWTACERLLGDDIAGDEGNRYDVILTSETIYSTDSYHKLHQIMREVLKLSGTIYLAAKTYYFGVGGGTRSFEDMVKKEGVFSSVVLQEFAEGVQREILQLRFKDGATR